MALSQARPLVALAGCGALALALQAPAHATTTFTHISTPAGPAHVLVDGTAPQVTIAGTASSDVAKVNIYCIRGSGSPPVSALVQSGVTVTAGSFSVTTALPDLGSAAPACRLRALPTGSQPDAFADTAFSGPVLYVDTVQRTTNGSATADFRITGASADGLMSASSAGRCGDAALDTLQADLSADTDTDGWCVAGLGGSAGWLRVDNHPALLPFQVLGLTNGTSALTTSFHVARNGQISWTESAMLMRCPNNVSYPPPSAGACGTPLVSTGVRFERSGTFVAGAHQIVLRDTFTSTDGQRHAMRTSYGVQVAAPSTGDPGYAFPGGSGGFPSSSYGQAVSGLPNRAATVLVRSDRYASEGDPQAATRAITWSRRPTRLDFSSSVANEFDMTYAFGLPPSGAVRLGFADSQATATATARRLGAAAATAMMPAPTISSPAHGAVISGTRTVVTGVLRAGANGLPVSVSVNGHPATIRVRSAGRATFRAVFREAVGVHRLTAIASDAGNNTRSASITVRNK